MCLSYPADALRAPANCSLDATWYLLLLVLPPHTQSNTTLQSINVSNNASMDKSWQKLLNHLLKGKAKA